MSETVNLNILRAEKTGDCRHMSVVDCLEDALREAKSGKWSKCVLLFYRNDEPGRFEIDTRCAGVSCLEARGMLLSEIKNEILDDVIT